MEYDHGVRVTPLTHEMSALEQGILNYQHQVAQYHKDKAKTCSSDNERSANEEELKKKRDFLDSRRRDLLTQAQVQERLQKYRKDARLEDNDWIYEEKHHTSDELLIQFMEIAGDVKPADNCEAHHIIPGQGWQSQNQVSARLNLHDCNVGINDPVNGVWLPAKIKDVPHSSKPLKRALPHRPLNTKLYEMWANNLFRAAQDESTARMALLRMRTRLLNGFEDEELIGTLTQRSRKLLGL